MARVTHTALQLLGSYPTLPIGSGAQITWVPADVTEKNEVELKGGEILLVWNSHASTSYACTVSSVTDGAHKRTGDITATLAGGEFRSLGQFQHDGWRQPSVGKLYFEATNAAVKFAVLRP